MTAYKTDGSSHRNGIKGELNILSFFNNPINFVFISSSINKTLNVNKQYSSFKFILKGGTQNRADLYCVNNNLSVSIKSKKKNRNGYQGTFDLINTSSISDFIGDNQKLKKEIEEWNKWNLEVKKLKKRKINFNEIKLVVNNFCNSILNSISGEEIKLLFSKILDIEKNVIEVIRDYKNSIDDEIKQEDIHFLNVSWLRSEFELINEKQLIISTKNSSFIKNKDNENSFFRLRVVLNNGVNALRRDLGIDPKIEGKNNNSKLTFKVQVDKVFEVIKKYDVNLIKKIGDNN